MREIEFRMYDKVNKKYFHYEDAMERLPEWSADPDAFGVVFEQYTGLNDKNGKKIFDGDIIKWDDDSNGKYWRVAVVKISPDIQFECFDCPLIKNSSAHGHVFHFGNFIYQDTEKWIEIIGNINDNPELLRVFIRQGI